MSETNNEVVETKTNGFAIAGLICSVLVSGLIGLILSIIGLNKVKECNSGKGLAIAGIIVGVLKMLLTFVLIIIIIVIMAIAGDQAAKCSKSYGCVCSKTTSTCTCKYKNSSGTIESITCAK